MPTVTVTAIKAFEHGGRMVAPGDPVETEPVKAVQLARKGFVSLARRYVTQAMKAEPEAQKPRRRRKVTEAESPEPLRYRRRDMTADPE